MRFTIQELRAVDAKAAAAGLPRATFLRRAALVRRINALRVSGLHLRAVYELIRLGNNLNQAVKLVHQGRLSPDLVPSIERLESAISSFRDELTAPAARAAEPPATGSAPRDARSPARSRKRKSNDVP
ncbi:MAG TPA: hypothetical protein VN783_12835 [Thermoanaerobaculia bacterium]|nr:hypothetical protein [Thermoanaerobaculia bacterium]